MKRSAGWEISNFQWINLPISQGTGYWASVLCSLFLWRSSTRSLQSLLWFVSFSVALPWLLSQSLPLAPQSHCSPLYLSHLISPILFPPLTVSLSNSFSTASLSLYLNPSISSSAPFSSDKHREWCTNTIPHISNEYLVIILSPQRLSVWLRLSLDSVTNGTASFSTAAIPQRWQTEMWCSAANAAQRDCRLMPQSDLHIYKGLFKTSFPFDTDRLVWYRNATWPAKATYVYIAHFPIFSFSISSQNLFMSPHLTAFWNVLFLFKVMPATMSVSGNTMHEICMRFESAVTTDSNLSVCYSRFRHLRSWYKTPQAPQICKKKQLSETSWKLQQ